MNEKRTAVKQEWESEEKRRSIQDAVDKAITQLHKKFTTRVMWLIISMSFGDAELFGKGRNIR